MQKKNWALRLGHNKYDHEKLYDEILFKIPSLITAVIKLEKKSNEVILTELYLLFKESVDESFVINIVPNSKIIYDISVDRIVHNAYKLIMRQKDENDYEHTN